MAVFLSTLNQMGFLFLLILIGYLLVRLRLMPEGTASILSKLENYVFIPALVLCTFLEYCTPERLREAGSFFLCGWIVILVTIPCAILLARLCARDDYTRKIFTYGLAFSNFGFMGNAVVAAVFPDVFMEYLVFVLPFWVLIYVWGVPTLLIPSQESKPSLGKRLRSLANPMMIATVVGAVLGLTQIPIPTFVQSAATSLGNCMSPLAMLLTGMTVAQLRLKDAFCNGRIYAVSVIRLLLIPSLALLVVWWLPLPFEMELCMICALAMPLGLNTIVVPCAYGKNTDVASGMALVSHIVSCITIPVIVWLFHQL